MNDVQEQVDRMEERLLKSIEASKGKTVEEPVEAVGLQELLLDIQARLTALEK